MKESTNSDKTNKITPAKAVEILAKEGMDISEEQASIVLEFMYKMARIELDEHLNRSDKKNELV